MLKTCQMARAILIGALIHLTCHSAAASDEKLERDFSERLSSVSVENPDGAVEVQTWPSRFVRLVASRPGARVFDSEISFERSGAEHVRIAVRPNQATVPVTIKLWVPASIHLAARSIKGSITIDGSLAGLSVDTESGAIILRLPEGSNSDLSLRALEGSIDATLAVKTFGQPDAHVLDGRIGVGGSTVIARSLRGNISLQSYNPARVAHYDAQPGARQASALVAKSKVPSSAIASTAAEDIRPGEDVVKLEARLVNLNVKVTDGGGRTLPALRKEDFAVYEDDVKQDLSYFEPVTAPLNIVLLLDLSGSTQKKIKIMKKAAQKFVDSLKDSDRIAVAGFTRRFSIVSNFTTDHQLLKDRIDDIKNRHGGTAYYDSMWAALDLLEEARTTRKAIVVLTDGVDNSLDHPDDPEFDPRHPFDELLARMEEADVTIYPIYFDTEYETIGRSGRNGHAAYMTARKQIEQVAAHTGAVMFRAERAEDLEGVYQQVAAELHSLYSMAYTPKVIRNDGKWRKVSVAVNLPSAKVRTKRGYFAK